MPLSNLNLMDKIVPVMLINKGMKRIGIIAKTDKAQAVEVSKELIPWLKGRGIEPVIDEELGALLGISGCCPKNQIASKSDMLLVLGGDGTLLAAARLAGATGIPILGVNLGSLGFLTEITIDELYPAMERVLKGEYETEERVMLSARVIRDRIEISRYEVLNDVFVSRGSTARIVDLETKINGDYVTTYKADGLIVSTPTGSTAYSLSAGGPIIYPSLHAFTLTPICPHTLTQRPVIVSDDSVITISILSKEDILITHDGIAGPALHCGDIVEIKKADAVIHLIKSPYRNYYEVIRKKLKWGER
ncbi:MAG: inorganic polyphosphate kinase [Deltaproteobacteria bacterium]|nr:inorganic polyphosphate kinase [Deltaproteobacteria bacterium]